MKNFIKLGQLNGLLLGLFLLATPAQAQYYRSSGKVELGLGVGPMFALTDLGGSAGIGRSFLKDLDLPRTKPSVGVYVTAHPAEWLGIRVAATLGGVAADDADAPSNGGAEERRLERNLHFRSKIQEAYAAIEFYPTAIFEQDNELTGKFRPYGLAGVGIFHFNPEVKDVDGSWVKTHGLRLEGQGFPEYPNSKPYQLTQMNLIGGFGFKYYINESMYLGTEVVYRKLMTDYLDDASQNYYIDPIHFDKYLPEEQAIQARRLHYRATYSYPSSRPYGELEGRGDPTENDSYFNTTIRLGWRLGASSGRTPRGQLCPVF